MVFPSYFRGFSTYIGVFLLFPYSLLFCSIITCSGCLVCIVHPLCLWMFLSNSRGRVPQASQQVVSELGLFIQPVLAWIKMEIATPKMVSLNKSNNWMVWKAKMEYLLYCKDMYKPIKMGSFIMCQKRPWHNLYRRSYVTLMKERRRPTRHWSLGNL